MSDLRARFGALTAAQVAALDAAAVALGVDVTLLMEVAGWQVARCAWRLLRRRPGRVGVVAGRGNNGGDALVAARHLATWGCTVRTLVVGEEAALRGPLATHVPSARAAGAAVVVSPHPDRGVVPVNGDVVLDGLFGTGLRSDPRPPDDDVVRALDGAPVLAIDVPSGLDATTGAPRAPCVRAVATCTLTAVKAGLWTAEGRARAGRLHVADIGMPAPAWAACGLVQPAAIRGGALMVVPDASP